LEDNRFSVSDLQHLSNSLSESPNALIGNEEYLLKTYLFRSYTQNNLTPDKSAFNYRLSRAKRRVEHTFGTLCAK
jgi:hypothetical protein